MIRRIMIYNDWTLIDYSPGIVEWIESYKQEDMLQVHFPLNYILDMGWYVNTYRIFIIHNQNWSEPLYSYSTDNETELAFVLSDFKAKIVQLIQSNTL